MEYEKGNFLYSFLGVLKNLKMHRSNFSSRVIVEFMYAQMTNKILGIVSTSNYVVLTCDKVNTIDNKNCISRWKHTKGEPIFTKYYSMQ